MNRFAHLFLCLCVLLLGWSVQGQSATVPAAPAPAPAVAPPANEGTVTHDKLPRFASLRFDDVNLRVGPGTNYPIDWVYRRRNLPVEIVFELGDWRQIRDQDNVTGWVRGPALWKRRSAMVRTQEVTLRASPNDQADPVAVLKPGVITHVRSCPAGSAWCEVEIDAFRGWLKRAAVYGVYADETIEGQ